MADDEDTTAHTPPGEHPAGDGPRSDRDVGGPTSGSDSGDGEETGGAHGTRESEFDSHE